MTAPSPDPAASLPDGGAYSHSSDGFISADGRYLAYTANGAGDWSTVIVRNLQTGVIDRSLDGFGPTLIANGGSVAYMRRLAGPQTPTGSSDGLFLSRLR